MEIIPLGQRPDFISVCAAWAFGEWGCLNGDLYERLLEDYTLRAHAIDIPAMWVAVENEKAVGMVSLKNTGHKDGPAIRPWVGSLYVHSWFRGKGIGSRLLKTTEDHARTLGFNELFLYTSLRDDYYRAKNWIEMTRVSDPMGLNDKGAVVFRKTL